MSQKNPRSFEIVGNDDEQHAARPEHAVRLGHELARGVDARHVLEHLIGVDDVAARRRRRDRRRPALDHLEALPRSCAMSIALASIAR